MCALILPFRGENYNQLYENITSGIYNPIPIQYSNDLKTIIKQILVVNPKNRPFSSELLENPIIKKKIVELAIYNKNNNKEKATLMKTNKISINMPQINKELSQKQYEKEKVQLNDENKTIKKAFYNQLKIKLKEEKNRDDNKNIKQKDEKTNNKNRNQKGKKTILNEEKKNKIDIKDMKQKDIEKNKNDIKNMQKDEEKNSNENKREKDIEIKLYDEENNN